MPRDSLGTGMASMAVSRRASVCTVLSADDRADDLDDDDLMEAVETLRSEITHLSLENQVLEHLLKRANPTLLNGLQESLDQAANAAAAQSRALAVTSLTIQPSASLGNLSARRSTDASSGSPRLSARERSPSVMRFGAVHKEPKLSTRHKMALVDRTLEDLRVTSEAAKADAKIAQGEHKARAESLRIAIDRARDAKDEFQAKMAAARRGRKGTLGAEEFVGHMEDWLTKADATTAKLRSQTSLLRSRHARLRKELALKMEANQAVNTVDVEQLQIENAELEGKLNATSREATLLKQKLGKCRLQSSRLHSQYCEQAAALDRLKQQCAASEVRVHRAKDRAVEVKYEVHLAAARLANLRGLQDNFSVPDVFDYLKKKSEVSGLKKELKTWMRRRNIQHISLQSDIQTLNKISANMAGDSTSCYSTSRKGHQGRNKYVLQMNTATPPPPSRKGT